MKTIKKLVIATLMVMSLVSCTNEPAPIPELSSPNETIITENIIEENIIVEDIIVEDKITNEDMIQKDYENGKISKEFYEECLYNSRKKTTLSRTQVLLFLFFSLNEVKSAGVPNEMRNDVFSKYSEECSYFAHFTSIMIAENQNTLYLEVLS